MTESNLFDRLLDSIISIESKTQNNCNFLVCGDFNSRTSNNPDFVVDDNPAHMNVLPGEYTPDNYMSRFSQDIGHVNNNGFFTIRLL